MTELTDNLIQLFCVLICGVYSCFSAITRKSRKWVFVTLFYLSFGIGITYWILYIVLFNSTPLVFCVSELSWTASYIFLAMRLFSGMSEDERKSRANLYAWLLPGFSLIMCIFFFLRGSYLENILMGTAIASCGFFAAKGLYFAKQKKQAGRFYFCGAVLFFYAAEYLLWISSYFYMDNTLFNPYFLADTFILNPSLILIAAAQHKEEKQCRTI